MTAEGNGSNGEDGKVTPEMRSEADALVDEFVQTFVEDLTMQRTSMTSNPIHFG